MGMAREASFSRGSRGTCERSRGLYFDVPEEPSGTPSYPFPKGVLDLWYMSRENKSIPFSWTQKSP